MNNKRTTWAMKGGGMETWMVTFISPIDVPGYYHVRLCTGERWRGTLEGAYDQITPTQKEIEVFIMLYPESEDRWQAKSYEELAKFSTERSWWV